MCMMRICTMKSCSVLQFYYSLIFTITVSVTLLTLKYYTRTETFRNLKHTILLVASIAAINIFIVSKTL
jgi:hypothetical protein